MSKNKGDTRDIHVLITGSQQAGISSFIYQKDLDHEPRDESGIGIDIQTTDVFLEGKEYHLIFYEIAGPFPLDSLKKIFKKKYLGLVIVFDLSNTVSLELGEVLFNQIQEKLEDKMPKTKFLLGSHLDLEKDISDEAIEALLTIMGKNTYYMEFSAKTGENLLDALELVAKKIME